MTWLRESVLVMGTVLMSGILSAAVSGCREPLNEAPAALGGEIEKGGPRLPARPVAMDEPTDFGARAFLNYFVATLNRAHETGDTTELEPLVGADCAECTRVISAINEVYGAGGDIDGGNYSIETLTLSCPSAGQCTATGFLAHEDQMVQESSAGQRVTYQAGHNGMRFSLTHDGSAWRLTDWGVAG